MPTLNYNLLTRILKFETALKWLAQDTKDDFYTDFIGYSDLRDYASAYLQNRHHRLLQFDATPHFYESVPKKGGLLRGAIWLHPIHRILYLAILRHLISRLDSKILDVVYSYRWDEQNDLEKHPFSNTIGRWKQFHNDFREATLDSSTKAVVVADLANFYEHINCKQLCLRIRSLLGSSADESDEATLDLLESLLESWSNFGYDIPHNHDPSSFFGSLYLHNVDQDMTQKRYRYFRWVDDIRIVATTRDQAIRALHDLQASLKRYNLFLSSEKSKIIEREDGKFDEMVDVTDDIILADTEEKIFSADHDKINSIIERLLSRMRHHGNSGGDDRKFRAFLNRLLDIGDYAEFKDTIRAKIYEYVIPRMKTHPERSDYWSKALATVPGEEVRQITEELLIDNPSRFNWQRFHLWKLALAMPPVFSQRLLDQAISLSSSTLSLPVTAQAILFLGKHGDNAHRENLFSSNFNSQKPYIIQRAILIAIQELPAEQRDFLYNTAKKIFSEHDCLIDYLKSRMSPTYGPKNRPEKHCREIPRRITQKIERGIGKSGGRIVKFRLGSKDYDYE